MARQTDSSSTKFTEEDLRLNELFDREDQADELQDGSPADLLELEGEPKELPVTPPSGTEMGDEERQLEMKGRSHDIPLDLKRKIESENGDLGTLDRDLQGPREETTGTLATPPAGDTASDGYSPLLILIPLLAIALFTWLFWRQWRLQRRLEKPVSIGPGPTGTNAKPDTSWSKPVPQLDFSRPATAKPTLLAAPKPAETTNESDRLPAAETLAELEEEPAATNFDFDDVLAGVSSLTVESADGRLSAATKEGEALRDERNRLTAELGRLQNRLEASQIETAAAREQALQLEERSLATAAAVEALRHERDEAVSQLRLLAAAKSDSERLDKQVAELSARLDDITAERDSLKGQLEDSSAEPAAGPISAADPMELAAWEQRYATLENQYDTILDERDRLLAEHAEMVAITQEAAHLAEEIQQLREANQTLERERNEVIQGQEAAYQQAAVRYASLEQQYDSLLAERDRLLEDQATASLTDSERERLELLSETRLAEYRQVRDELEESRQAAAELERQVASWQEKQQAAHSERDRLQQELTAALQDSTSQTELDELRRVISMHQDTVTRLNAALEAAQERAAENEKQAEQLRGELERWQRDYEELRNQGPPVPGSQFVEQLRHLESTVLVQETTIARLNTEKEETLGRFYETVAERDKLQRVVEDFQASAADEDQENQRIAIMQDRLAQLEREAAQLRERLTNAEQEATTATANWQSAAAALAAAEGTQAEMEDLRNENERLEKERRESLDQLQAALRRAASLDAHLRENEAQLAIVEADADLITSLKERLDDADSKARELHARLEKRDSQLTATETEMTSLQGQLAASLARTRDLQQTLDKTELERKSTSASLAAATAQLQELANLRSELTNLREQSIRWEQEKQQTLEELQQLQSRYQQSQSDLRDSQTELTHALAEAKAVKHVTWEQSSEQLTRLSTERDTAIRAWGAAEQRSSDLQASLREQQARLRKMEIEQERVERHLQEHQAAYREQLEQSFQVGQPWKSGDDDETQTPLQVGSPTDLPEQSRLRRQVAEISREKRQLVDELEAIREQNRRLAVAAEDRERDLAELAHEHESLRTVLTAPGPFVTPPAEDTADLRQQWEDSQQEVTRLKARLANATRDAAERTEVQATIRELRQALHDQEANVVKLEREAVHRNDDLLKEKEQRREMSVTVKQLEQQLAAWEDIEQERSRNAVEQASLHDDLAQARADLARVRSEKRKSSAAIRSAEQRIEALELTLARREEEIESLQQSLGTAGRPAPKKAAKSKPAKKTPPAKAKRSKKKSATATDNGAKKTTTRKRKASEDK